MTADACTGLPAGSPDLEVAGIGEDQAEPGGDTSAGTVTW